MKSFKVERENVKVGETKPSILLKRPASARRDKSMTLSPRMVQHRGRACVGGKEQTPKGRLASEKSLVGGTVSQEDGAVGTMVAMLRYQECTMSVYRT